MSHLYNNMSFTPVNMTCYRPKVVLLINKIQKTTEPCPCLAMPACAWRFNRLPSLTLYFQYVCNSDKIMKTLKKSHYFYHTPKAVFDFINGNHFCTTINVETKLFFTQLKSHVWMMPGTWQDGRLFTKWLVSFVNGQII